MVKKKNWVDYKEIKQKISLESVLKRYGIFDQLKPSGKNLVSCCPIHTGSNPRQFSVNLEKNLWNCFGNCKAGGNIIDFVAMKEFGTNEKKYIRKAALLIKNWFLSDADIVAGDAQDKSKDGTDPAPKKSNKLDRKKNGDDSASEIINPPLKFELKNLALEHPFFEERGILPETVKHFGLGLCNAGKTIPGRIAIPIHNEIGELIAYCGRAVTEDQVDQEGKYKQPANFRKSAVVYNLHRQPAGQKILILVESFISVWKLRQAGFPNAVALMGSKLCEAQQKLILSYFKGPGGVLLMFDADEDGDKCTLECFNGLGGHLFVKKIDLSPFARKPHQLTPEELKSLI